MIGARKEEGKFSLINRTGRKCYISARSVFEECDLDVKTNRRKIEKIDVEERRNE